MNQAIAIEGPWKPGVPRFFVAPTEAAEASAETTASTEVADDSWEVEIDNTTRAYAVGYFFQLGEADSANPDMLQAQKDYHAEQAISHLEALAVRSADVLPPSVLAQV